LTLLCAALLLPSLFWDKGPETASLLRRAHITDISVPASAANAWKSVRGMSVEIVDPKQLTRVLTPSVTFQDNEASASRAPWVNANGWRFLRQPDGHFYYEAPGSAAVLAAAEAFTYRGRAVIHTDDAGIDSLGRMLEFLKRLGRDDMAPLVNIGFIDDGSSQSGEFMNLLVRRNLLFKVVKQSDPKLDLTVALGTTQYPRSEAGNPSLLAEKVRSNLTDEKRLLRLYGSEVVVGRLAGNSDRARLYLINYRAGKRAVDGMRVRVRGAYPRQEIAEYDAPNPRLMDVTVSSGATEFTLPELKTFGVINLSRE
jgi:hypothetical protein